MASHKNWLRVAFNEPGEDEEDGGLDDALVPGTGEDTEDDTDTDSPAGESNTDTDGEGDRGPIPYSRFKEVNDQLKEIKGTVEPIQEILDVGYDADSLRQLADLDMRFRDNPVQTWLAVAKQIDGLPKEALEALESAVGSSGTPAAKNGSQEKGEEEIPEWAKPVVAHVQQNVQREAQEARTRMLDTALDSWRKADEKAGIKTSERAMLTFIQSAAPRSKSIEELVRLARTEYLEERDEMIGTTAAAGKRKGPRSVPGSGAPANGEAEPQTLEDATKLAMAYLEENK